MIKNTRYIGHLKSAVETTDLMYQACCFPYNIHHARREQHRINTKYETKNTKEERTKELKRKEQGKQIRNLQRNHTKTQYSALKQSYENYFLTATTAGKLTNNSFSPWTLGYYFYE